MVDAEALVIGSGPAGLAIASALTQLGVTVAGLSPTAPTAAWPNTYGIWCDELETLQLSHLLGHRWHDCVAYFGAQPLALQRDYGLFDKAKLQTHLLSQCQDTPWHTGLAAQVEHFSDHSRVTTETGAELTARIVIDASGHTPALIQRPAIERVGYQAAYGIVGSFSAPPIRPGQFVFMDYRADHLPLEALAEPPTFLYAMDLGSNLFFVEETSLAYSPAVSFEHLKQRLYQRLEYQGIQVKEIQHVERCLFPMNLPLPDFSQAIVGFGGAASMVHPASGYMVGSLLRRAPALASAIAAALHTPNPSPAAIARASWQALWSPAQLQKYYIYRFGLEILMRFDQAQLCRFFNTFFQLPLPQWSSFLANTQSTPELLIAMLNLFSKAPNRLRGSLMSSLAVDGNLLWQAIQAKA